MSPPVASFSINLLLKTCCSVHLIADSNLYEVRNVRVTGSLTTIAMFLLNRTYCFIIFLSLVNEMLTIDLCNEDNSTEVTSYFSKDVATTECGCERTKCVRKCCKPGFLLSKKFCVKNNSSNLFKLSVYTNKTVSSDLEINRQFLVGIMNCTRYFRLNNLNPGENFYLQEDGTLWVPLYSQFYDNDAYCMDELHGVTALLCFPEAQNSEVLIVVKFNIIGMIISMPFLLATFLVYLILPDSNLHRKALMSYVLTLLLAYVFLVTVQLYDGEFAPGMCQTLGFSVIFFFMVSFFWMNVMCIDMWFAFSGLRGFGRRHTERKRFLFYCLYAWGMPVLHVLIVFLLNEYGDQSKDYYPGVGKTKCFLEDKLPNLLYFYGPMAILITINIVLFILTAVKIQKVKKETSMLKNSDSKRHTYEDDKQKFNLYLKLLFAMGINWTMEIISWAVIWKTSNQVPAYVWYLTDFCNAMYGALIFFIFVFKKKIWKSLQKRYYVFIGKPHLAHSMTMTQTTRSSNYSTTDTGLSDHRLSELRNGRGGDDRALTQN